MKHHLRILLAASIAAGIAFAAQARDLTVVSWGGAYQDAQRDGRGVGPGEKAPADDDARVSLHVGHRRLVVVHRGGRA